MKRKSTFIAVAAFLLSFLLPLLSVTSGMFPIISTGSRLAYANPVGEAVTDAAPGTISDAPAGKATVGTPYIFTPTADDAGNSYSFRPTAGYAESFSITNKPPWATFDPPTGALTGMPGAADVGAYPGIVISATNASGSASLPAFTIVVQAPPPVSFVLSTLPDESTTWNPILNVSGVVTRPGGGSGTITVNGKNLSIGADGGFFSSLTLKEGKNTVTVSATDAIYGYIAEQRTITLDHTAPPIVLSAPADNSTTSHDAVTVTGKTAEEGTAVRVAVIGGPTQEAEVNGREFSASVNLAPGMNTIVIKATSPAGKTIAAKRTVIYVPGKGGVAITEPEQDLQTCNTWYLLRGVVETGVTAITVTGRGLFYRPEVRSGGFEQMLLLREKDEYVISVTTADQNGNSTTSMRTIIVPKGNDCDQHGKATVGSPYTFTPAAPAGSSFSVANTPSWLQFDSATGTLSGTPTSADIGTFRHIVITATSPDGSVPLPELDIDVLPTLPRIAGTPATVVFAGEAYLFTPTAATAESFGIDNKPHWADFDTATGALSGTPGNNAAASYPDIVISAYNRSGKVSLLPFSIKVFAREPLPLPTISGTPNDSVVAGDTFTFTPTSTNAAVFTIGNKPQWAGFDTATGTLTGTPTNTDSATTYGDIIISAANSTGTVTLPPFAVTVVKAAGIWQKGSDPDDPLGFAVDPTDGKVVYACTSTAVLKSTNGGGSWKKLTQGLPPSGFRGGISIDPSNSRTIYVMAEDGAFKSVDGGDSWILANRDFAYGWIVDPDHSRTIYTSDPSAGKAGLYKSTDGGVSWSGLYKDFQKLTIDPNDGQTLYALGGSLYKSTNGGGYWTVSWSGVNVSYPFLSQDAVTVAVDPSNSQNVYLSSRGYGGGALETLHISGDAGNSWAHRRGILADSIAISPTDSGTVYYGTASGVLGCSDYVLNLSSGLPPGDGKPLLIDLAFDPTDPRTLYANVKQSGRHYFYKGFFPPVSGTPPTVARVGDSYSFTPTAPGAVSFSIGNKPPWASFDPATGALTGTPATGDMRDYSNIVITASYSNGAASLCPFTLKVYPKLPTISGQPDSTAVVGKEYSFTPSASNGAVFGIVNKPLWASFDSSTGALTGTPTRSDIGTYEDLAIYVAGASLPKFSITVTTVPTISGTAAETVTAGDAYSFRPSASYAESFSITNKPIWGIFDPATGALTGTPTAMHAGAYPGIVISAINIAGTASLPAFTIAVDLGPPPSLAVSTLPDESITANAVLNVSGVATGGGGGVKALSSNGIRIPMSADGSFSYALTLAEGINTVTVIATDHAGVSTTDSRTITFDLTAPAIVVFAPADNSATPQGPLTVSGKTGEAGTAVQVAVNGGPPQAAEMNGTTFSSQVNLVPGLNTVVISATTAAGKVGTAKRTVSFDPGKGALAIVDPDQDVRISKGWYLLKGVADDPGSISVAVDGRTLAPEVTNGFEQELVFTEEKEYAVVVTTTDQGGKSATVQRNIIFSKGSAGDLNGNGKVDMGDAIKVLQSVVGMTTLTAAEHDLADVAPLDASLAPRGDGKVDIADVIALIRRLVGVLDW